MPDHATWKQTPYSRMCPFGGTEPIVVYSETDSAMQADFRVARDPGTIPFSHSDGAVDPDVRGLWYRV